MVTGTTVSRCLNYKTANRNPKTTIWQPTLPVPTYMDLN